MVVLQSICYFNFFFFKQKTAYEMRISDWSSDVCSSDLLVRGGIMRAGRSFVVRAQPHAPHAFALEIKLAPDVDHQRQFGRNRNAEAKLKHRPPIRLDPQWRDAASGRDLVRQIGRAHV